MSQICQFDDWSVSGQKEYGLSEHGTLIIVIKIVLSYFGRVCLQKHNKSCKSLNGDMQGV